MSVNENKEKSKKPKYGFGRLRSLGIQQNPCTVSNSTAP